MPFDERRMTFTEHLGELRTRIIHSGIAVIVAFFVCYAVSDNLFLLLARPLMPLAEQGIISTTELPPGNAGNATTEGTPAKAPERGLEWTILNPLEGFVVKFKIAVYAGVLLALPYLLFQVCAFIFPGLLPHERRAALFLLVGCGGLAVAGVAVAYWVVFPMLLPYLTSWAPPGVKLQLRMNETVSIILKGLAGFAIAFQFPMIVITLVYIGILHPDVLRKQRRVAVIIMAVVAAVFTPPDPISMLVMMVPLLALYEVSIWASYLVLWRRAKQAEAASCAPQPAETTPETRQIE